MMVRVAALESHNAFLGLINYRTIDKGPAAGKIESQETDLSA